ncbi:MAG: Zn-ribbon containing protein [Candidatus Altiarchaeota archaeon]
MPYKCTVCGKIYLEGSDQLKAVMREGGCECGKKFLMYFRGARDLVEVEDAPAGKHPQDEASGEDDDKEPIISEIPADASAEKKESLKWLDTEFLRMREKGKPLHLGIETIRILEEGKYEIDVGSLMRGRPIIVQTEEGVYYIDLAHAMKKKGEKR